MLATVSFISTLLALTVTIACIFFVYREGKDIRDASFLVQRRAFLAFYICLCLYLTFTLYRTIGERIEVVQTMSLISLYLIIEVFFFASTAFNQEYYYNKKAYWAFFNTPVIISFAIYIALFAADHKRRYFSLTDFFDDFSADSRVCVYFRTCIILLLFCYKLIMLYLVFKAWYNQEQILKHDRLQRHNSTRIGKILLLWFFMLLIFYVGQFVNWNTYHIAAKLIYCILTSFCFYGFQRYYTVAYRDDSHSRYVDLRKRINTWLAAEQFPLAATDISLDTISRQLSVDRDDLSFFIYNILGLTFNGWLSAHRLEKCQQLLIHSDLNMSEIAYATGYAHLAAMSKAFKAKYGIAPKEYRKSHQKSMKT